ncbi:MAG TPA: BTAD domain-containing putative transcriptional regulator [Pyrinomonadaceae bacterium]|nr:BTAD domain-containing putative transcriptional regulator [Pyrinomonadaceae bacterium]
MSRISVHLFGRFRARAARGDVDGLDACKVQELLCYLLVHRDRPHARESLAALLWGDTPTAKSKKYLRQALWQLQTALDARDGEESPGVLTVEHDWVRLNSNENFWLDVAVFERAFALAKGAPGREMDEARAALLREAVEVYAGDLLEGWYQDWCLYERERLQNMYLAMLDKLIGYSEAHQQFELGLTYGAQILRHDRARERTHRQMMSLQYLSGDRTAALRQYERCAAALDEELGVRPDKRTSALYQQIRAGSVETGAEQAAAQPQAPREADAGSPSLADVLGRLNQIQTILADMQQRVNQEIKAVKLVIGETR